MFGFDSRAAMVPGGAAEGFGNLGAALLLSPQIRRRDQDEERRHQEDQAFRQKQLDQALQIAQAGQMNDRARIADEDRYRNADLDLRKGEATSRQALAWTKSLASAIDGVLPKSTTGREPQFKPDPYKDVVEMDENGKPYHTKVPKSPEEMDNDRSLWDRGRNGPPPPAGPQTPDQEVVAGRKARNAQVQSDQRKQGLASKPGDRAPIPSTGGVGEVMPDPAQLPARQANSVARAPMLTKEHLLSKVGQGPGMFPTLEAAYQDATKRGYAIQGL